MPWGINSTFLKTCNAAQVLYEGPSLMAGGYSSCVTFMKHEEYQLSKRLGKWNTAGELGNFLCGQLTEQLRRQKLPALNWLVQGMPTSALLTFGLLWYVGCFRYIGATIYLYLHKPKNKHKRKDKEMQAMDFPYKELQYRDSCVSGVILPFISWSAWIIGRF